jgi:hypothetical protein
MAMDAFIVFAASYDTLGAAEADYHAVREFYLTSGLLDTYDAAVITRRIRGGEGEAAQRVMISTRVNPPRQVTPAKGWPWTSGRWS